jgi:cell division protein FtsI/penicillin-binding protein 2
VKPNTPGNPRPEAPWYRVSAKGERTHAWFIGFAPADDPQIAFAVMVEYGGSGGTDAAPIVKALLDGCVKHRYLLPPGNG